MTKILVTGAKGQLGSEIKEISAEFHSFSFCFTDFEELDITCQTKVSEFFEHYKPDFVVNCAAYTAVDKAETEIDLATKLNALAVGILAEESAKLNCRLIHISTDYVFDGKGPRPYTEDEPVNPQSVYGRTKLEGELLCLKNNPQSIVVRTSWLYSKFGNNFVKTMLRLGNERTEVGVIADQIGSPTNAADLARAILTIISFVVVGNKNLIPGVYHYSNEGVASWYDFTKAIYELSGLKCQVNPISSEEYPSPVKRPPYSVMNKSKIKLIFGIQIPYWRTSLEDYIQKI